MSDHPDTPLRRQLAAEFADLVAEAVAAVDYPAGRRDLGLLAGLDRLVDATAFGRIVEPDAGIWGDAHAAACRLRRRVCAALAAG